MKKQQFKRVSVLLIIICLLFTSFYNLIPKITAQNEDEVASLASDQPNAKRYFGDQLGKEGELGIGDSSGIGTDQLNQIQNAEVSIYNTLEKMRDDEIFMKGNIDCPVTVNLNEMDKGLLLQAFSKARDAFKMDNPDLFYVDFDKLTIRTSNTGTYVGIGRSTDYLLNGFTTSNIPDAIKKYEEKIDEIVSKAQLSKANNTSDQEEIGIMNEIIYVHDYLVENMVYKYENECLHKSDGSICNHRTAYDGLINHEGVCEAYTRAFKAVMDRLDIPTICVYGLYKAKDTFSEEHIWNYVYWSDAWYGIDVTHDDPTTRNQSKKDLLKSELENRDYFMVSETDLAIHHLPSGVISSIDYIPFTYPGITLESQQNNKTLFNNDGQLKVKLNKTYYSEDLNDEAIPSADIYVSYQGHSVTWNAKNNKYIVCKFSQYRPGTDTWSQMDWAYITPELYPVIDEVENSQNPDPELGEGYTKMPVPHIGKVQFAVTDVPPDTSVEGVLKGGLYYKGDPLLLESVTEEIDNPWGTYIAPPYPKKATPGLNGRLKIGRTYEIKLEYDDKLLKIPGEEFGIDVETQSYYDGLNTALKNCKLEEEHFDNENTITFKFTPSNMFNDDLTMYIFNIKGLVGEQSQKRPIPVSYVFAFDSNVGCSRVRADGGQYYAYGQPKLLADGDVANNIKVKSDDSSDWENIDESITHRLTLVAKQTSTFQQQELKDFVENDQKVNVDKVQTYNIQLNLCKKQVLMTGDRVKVCVGFPQGYSIDDVGVSFVAYHYITDEHKNIVDVEEIPCEVTEQGLVIWVNSFSPFLIAETEKPADQTNKTLSFNISEGGTAKIDKENVSETSLIELKNNESKTIQITPNQGYKIDSINVNGKAIEVNPEQQTLTINSDSEYFKNHSAVNSAQVNVNFVSDTAKSRDENRPTISNLDQISIKINNDNPNILTANVANYEGKISYQWFKNDQLLESQTASSYSLPTDKTRQGSYKVVATISDESSGTAITISDSKKIDLPENIHTITLNPNGGEFNPDKLTSPTILTDEKGLISAEDINKICDPDALTRVGYKFIGWADTPDHPGYQYEAKTFPSSYFKENKTIYAIWEAKENEYLINLDMTEGKLNITNDNLSKAVSEEELINLNNNVKYFVVDNGVLKDSLGNTYKSTPAAIKTGLEFSGWKSGDETIKDFSKVTSNITVSPSFGVFDDQNKQEESYDIVLDPAEGSLQGVSDAYELIKNEKLDLPLPIRDNYYFAGWYTSNDSGHSQRISTIVMNDDFINLHYKIENHQTHSITLLAYWIPQNAFNLKVYPETIDSSQSKESEVNKPGHVIIIGQKRGDQNINLEAPKEGDIVTYKAYPEKGFIFKGWLLNEKPIDSVKTSAVETKDETELTIKFNPLDQIVARFDKEDNTETETKDYKVKFIDPLNNKNNSEITVKDGKLPELPEIKNANFEGWYTEEIGGVKVEKGYSVLNDMTLYAHYKTSQIEISANVSPEKAGTVKGTGKYSIGEQITLEAVPNEGYQFTNWTLDNKIISSEKLLPITVEESVTYTAHFSKDSDLDPDHQFKLDSNSIYLTTLENGKTEADITALSDNPLEYEWENNSPTIISVIKSSGNKLRIKAIAEGVGFITAKSGDVERTARVVVSDDAIVINNLFAYSNSPDEVTIEASGVLSNPALDNESEVDSLSIFAWSEPDQSDMNAKVIDKNSDGNWEITLPINDNDTHTFFNNADKINIHFYAHTDKGLEMVGSTVYNYSTNSYGNHHLIANGYAQDIGFIKPAVYDEKTIGTTGESRQLEGIRLASPLNGVDLSYSVHMSDIGWSDETPEGEYAGTMWQNRQLEAIKINLNGVNANNYNIQYRAHVADKGWLDWVNEGEMAGTEGEARRLEAIEIRIIEK